jgi:RHS repeat-associated protein
MPVANYLWDALEDNIVEEFDDAGNTIVDYTTEPEQFGNVISQNRNGQSSFFHYDAQGSTLALTDESDAVTDIRGFTAFGATTESSGSTLLRFQFVGQKGYLTSDASTMMVRRRDYSSTTARWLSRDPISSNLERSQYWYCDNRPLKWSDPSGEAPIRCACACGHPHRQRLVRITVDCKRSAQVCCRDGCRRTIIGPGVWGRSCNYTGDWERVGALPDRLDGDSCGDAWWDLPFFFDCFACCVRAWAISNQLGIFPANTVTIGATSLLREPKAVAVYGQRATSNTLAMECYRAGMTWRVAGRYVFWAFRAPILVEGGLDIAAEAWCAAYCSFRR